VFATPPWRLICFSVDVSGNRYSSIARNRVGFSRLPVPYRRRLRRTHERFISDVDNGAAAVSCACSGVSGSGLAVVDESNLESEAQMTTQRLPTPTVASSHLTGFEPTFENSGCCATPSQTCTRLRVRGENANWPVCTDWENRPPRKRGISFFPAKKRQLRGNDFHLPSYATSSGAVGCAFEPRRAQFFSNRSKTQVSFC
jgi:hypothetical protein